MRKKHPLLPALLAGIAFSAPLQTINGQVMFSAKESISTISSVGVYIDKNRGFGEIVLFDLKQGEKWRKKLPHTISKETALISEIIVNEQIIALTYDGGLFKLDTSGNILDERLNSVKSVAVQMEFFGSDSVFIRSLVPDEASKGFKHIIYKIKVEPQLRLEQEREVDSLSKLINIKGKLFLVNPDEVKEF